MLTPPGLKGKQYRVTGRAYPRLARPNLRRRYTVLGVLGVMALAILGWGSVQLFGVFGGGKAAALACGAKATAAPSAAGSGAPGSVDAAGPGPGSGSASASAGGSAGASAGASGSAGASAVASPAAIAFAHLTAGQVPKPGAITVNVYNATDRAGLAGQTAALLKKRGFVIGKVGNAPAALQHKVLGTAQVTGNAAAAARMTVVGSEIVDSKPTTDLRKNATVDLVLGNGFSGDLATPVQQAQTITLAAKPVVAPSPGHC